MGGIRVAPGEQVVADLVDGAAEIRSQRGMAEALRHGPVVAALSVRRAGLPEHGRVAPGDEAVEGRLD